MQAKTQSADRVSRFEALCRARGLALTVQRRAIFAAIVDRRDHPTADQVYESLHRRLPGVSRTTVYRVLETLVQAGLIAKACHPGAAARYDPLTHRHHHLVCVECEKVLDLDDARLDALPLPRIPRTQFEIQDYCVHFRGRCADCRRSARPRSASRSSANSSAARGPSHSKRATRASNTKGKR